MSSSNLIRLTGLVSMVAGVLYVVRSILSPLNQGTFADFDSSLDYLGYAILGCALLLTLVTLVGLHVQRAGGYGFLGWTGFLTAFVAYALMFVGITVDVLSGGAEYGSVISGLGFSS